MDDEMHYMELEGQLHDQESEEYMDEIEDDLEVPNEEVDGIMFNVFGTESDSEEF